MSVPFHKLIKFPSQGFGVFPSFFPLSAPLMSIWNIFLFEIYLSFLSAEIFASGPILLIFKSKSVPLHIHTAPLESDTTIITSDAKLIIKIKSPK